MWFCVFSFDISVVRLFTVYVWLAKCLVYCFVIDLILFEWIFFIITFNFTLQCDKPFARTGYDLIPHWANNAL